jgi:hypothetical protein
MPISAQNATHARQSLGINLAMHELFTFEQQQIRDSCCKKPVLAGIFQWHYPLPSKNAPIAQAHAMDSVCVNGCTLLNIHAFS